MTKTVYYTIVDHRDYISENETWDWDKMKGVINETLMPEYRTVEGAYCPEIQNFISAYENTPIFVPVSESSNYSELYSGQLFTLVKQDEPENCITDIRMNDSNILDIYSDDEGPVYWEEDYGPVSP